MYTTHIHLTARLTSSFPASLLVYLLGLIFTGNYVLIFIITVVLLAMDFYYLKNIAGRRLVGLRWWNEVHPENGDSNWVFESADPETKIINPTDKRFFWLAVYVQPVSWVALGLVAIVKVELIWLSLVGECCNLCFPSIFPFLLSSLSFFFSAMDGVGWVC